MSRLAEQTMIAAGLPTGKPSEAENASQPEVSSTTILSLQSQSPKGVSQLEKLKWYQTHRTSNTLLWVQCGKCNKWRFIAKVYERNQLPEKWYCNLHPDELDCTVPEEAIPLQIEADLVYSEFSLGSLVLVRLDGWPWWPAMIDDDPDVEQFYWIDELCDIPSFYHVTLFDDTVSRAWIQTNKIVPFNSENIAKYINLKKFRKRIQRSVTRAKECAALDFPTRLKKFSFISLYGGPIKTPKHVTQEDTEKYDAKIKRKYSMDTE